MDAWTTLTQEISSALGAVADLTVSASVLMLALLGLGLWRAAHHRRTAASSPERTVMPVSPAADRLRQIAERIRTGSHALAASSRRRQPAGFRVHWDRTVPALAAVAALAVALVAGVAAMAGAPTGELAGVALVLGLGCVAVVVALVTRDRRPAVPVTETEAEAETGEVPVQADPRRDRRILDTVLGLGAEPDEPVPAEPAAPAAPVEEPEPRPAARAAAHAAVTLPAVPRPTYLDAPEAPRQAPEPLAAEPVPATSGARLKDLVAAADRPQDAEDGLTVLAGDAADEEETVSAAGAAEIAALDLDSVLARRRAS